MAVVPFLKLKKGNALYQALKRLTVLGEIPPGTTLTEAHLAEAYGCSQGTVREALLRLQEDGLVVRDGYRGTTVSTTTRDETDVLIGLRLQIEREGVRRALPRLDAARLERLAELVRLMEERAAEGDGYAVSELDRSFHLTVLKAARLPALEPILARCLLHIHRYTVSDAARTRALIESARRHWVVVEALRGGVEATAIEVMTRHITTVLENGGSRRPGSGGEAAGYG